MTPKQSLVFPDKEHAGRVIENTYDWPYRGPIPDRLYRVFSEREHADAFIRGDVWCRSLVSCRNMETAGRDEKEGQPSVAVGNGKVSIAPSDEPTNQTSIKAEDIKLGWHVENPEIHFVCCFSVFEAPPQGSKFGEYVVEIHNPARMLKAWGRAIAHLQFGRVIYFDDSNIDALWKHSGPGWLFKGNRFAHECEFRVCVEFGNLAEVLQSAGAPKADLNGSTDGLTHHFPGTTGCVCLLP